MGLSYPRPNLYVLAHFALLPLTLLAIRAEPRAILPPRLLHIRRPPLRPIVVVIALGLIALAGYALSLQLLILALLLLLLTATIRGEPAGWLALYTWLAGFAWWLIMLYWLYPVTAAGTVALAALTGLAPTAFVLSVRLIRRHLRPRLPLVLLVPAVWVALEYVRGRLTIGFSWYLLGHSQPTPMIQIADFAGAYGVSFLVAMTSGALADLLTTPLVRPGGAAERRSRRSPRSEAKGQGSEVRSQEPEGGGGRWGPAIRFSLPLWLIVVALTLGYGVFRIRQTDRILSDGEFGDAGPLRVAVVQTNVPQSNKEHPTEEQTRANFSEMLRLSERAAEHEPDLMVWPETMIPAAINEESVRLFRRLGMAAARYRERTEQFARAHGIALIVGAHAQTNWHWISGVGYRPTDRYNAAYLLTPEGRVAARYDKIHRVPFGEYLPLVEALPPLMWIMQTFSPYETYYGLAPGSQFDIFHLWVGGGPTASAGEIGGTGGMDKGNGGGAGGGVEPGVRWGVGTPICFEDVVSYVPRRMVWREGRKRATVLVNLTNDGWFAGTAQGPQHEQIARFRCIENRVPMARAVNTGISGFIDSAGRVIDQVSVRDNTQQVAGFAVANLHRDPRATLFSRIGDGFAIADLTAVLALIVLALSRKLWSRGRA